MNERKFSDLSTIELINILKTDCQLYYIPYALHLNAKTAMNFVEI